MISITDDGSQKWGIRIVERPVFRVCVFVYDEGVVSEDMATDGVFDGGLEGHRWGARLEDAV